MTKLHNVTVDFNHGLENMYNKLEFFKIKVINLNEKLIIDEQDCRVEITESDKGFTILVESELKKKLKRKKLRDLIKRINSNPNSQFCRPQWSY